MAQEQKYPLSQRESDLLVNELLGSGAVFIAIGIVFSIIITGASSGDWFWTIVYSGWAYQLGCALGLGQNPVLSLAVMVGLPALVLLLSEVLLDHVLWAHSENYRADTYEIRRGVNGELTRLPVQQQALTAAVAGFAEEFAFRYGGIGVLYLLFAQLVSADVAMVGAIVVVSALFAAAHGQYERLWQRLVLLAIALLFGFAYVLTGSLLAVAVAHALYDFGAEQLERRKMLREEAYFGEGEPPDHVIEEQIKELRDAFDDFRRGGE